MSRTTRLVAILLVAAALMVTVYAAGGGTASDPLISLSYLNQIFTKKVEDRLHTATQSLAKMADQGVTDSLTATLQGQLNAAVAEKIMSRVAEKIAASGTLSPTSMTRLTLSAGDRVVGAPGTGLILESGGAVLYGGQTAEILNLTLGGIRNPGPTVTTSYFYMLTAADGSGFKVTTPSATILARDGARVIKAYTPLQNAKADALKAAGLFVGTNAGYELDRPPTRQEALIMLIRLLGEESTALGHVGTTTFKDLAGWADGQKYIVYAHNRGYTNGASPTAFIQYDFATLEMYLSFTLRALGYSDAAGDFIWNTTSRDLAVKLGLLTQTELNGIAATGFMRDHVVLISANALRVPLKGSPQTLGQKLLSQGVITEAQYDALQ